MKQRTLTKQQVEEAPHEVWNAFVDVLATEDYHDLSPEQRPAHLVFWYESEVQNGGHLQYFENRGGERLDETIAALKLLGASCQQRVLRDAARLWRSRPRPSIQSAENYCERALEGEFSALDTRFHACKPSLTNVLQEHLRRNQSLYVAIQ